MSVPITTFAIALAQFIADAWDEGAITKVYDDAADLNPAWWWDE